LELLWKIGASVMKRWAIAIGINRYHSFQPLSFAQQDAQAIRDFLVNEAGFLPENCFLLTDSSPALWGKSTYPNRATIQGWFDLLCQQHFQPGDLLWVFFSGYGACIQGRDYWVPIDANPANLQTTSILVETIFNRLKSIPTETTLVLLDVSRSQSSLANEPIGAQTAQLAHRLGISTILSCQPGQFSNEAGALGHGFFTAALLEGLRSRPFVTLAGLKQYLGDRLPELSQHNLRPIQQPMVISSDENLQQMVLPAIGAPTGADWGSSYSEANPSQEWDERAALGSRATASTGKSAALLTPNQTSPLAENSDSNGNLGQGTAPVIATSDSNMQGFEDKGAASSETVLEGETADISPRQLSLFWGGVTAASLLLAVGVFWKTLPFIVGNERAVSSIPGSGVPSNNTSESRPAIASLRASTGEPSTGNKLPSYTTSAIAPRSKSSASAPPASPISSPKPGETRLGVSSAQTLGTGVRNQVLAATTTQQGLLSSARLDTARAKAGEVVGSQASPYWFAIQEARKIKPGDPNYQEAQQEIAHWSQRILTVAKRRASQRQFDSAILAAALVPQDQPAFAGAERALDVWCPLLSQQRVKSRLQRRQAKNICQQG
jgi:uncharacterized caspase-like protein